MKSSWGIVLTLCVVAALVLVMRFGRPDAAPDVDEPGARGDRHAGAAPEAGGNAPAGSADEAPRRGQTTGGDRGETTRGERGESTRGDGGERLRGRLPAAVIEARKRAAERRGDQRAAGAGGAGGELAAPSRLERSADASSLPASRSRDTQGAGGAMDEPADEPAADEVIDDAAPETIPEVAYDGGADHVFDTRTQSEVTDAGKITGEAGTISFWIQPEWQLDNQDDAGLVQLGSGLGVAKDGNFLRFTYTDGTKRYGIDADIGQWQAGDRHHVAVTWTGTTLVLYVDGGQGFVREVTTPPAFESEPRLSVGSAFPSGTPVAPGQLSHLTVLNRDLSRDEVTATFESGAPP